MAMPAGQASDGVSRPQIALERVNDAIARRGDQPKGRRYDFHTLCPVHDENTGSMHVTYRPDIAGGKVMLFCFGCGASEREIAEALGLTVPDLFDQPLPEPDPAERKRDYRSRKAGRRMNRRGPLPKRIAAPPKQVEDDREHEFRRAAVYDYVTADGELIQQVIRKECANGHRRHKEFTQTYFAGGAEVYSKPDGFQPVIFRLPEVTDALVDDETVWIVEGEKDVLTAEKHGLIACTNAGGSGSFPVGMTSVFDGATVRLVMDRDPAGYTRGLSLLDLLREHAQEISLLLPATTADKSDLTDHFAADFTAEDFLVTTELELRALVEADRVGQRIDQIEECEREFFAHVAEAEARQTNAPKTAEQHHKRAIRWAQEGEVRLADFADTTARTIHFVGAADSLLTAGLDDYAASAYSQALTSVRELYQHIGLDLPPTLRHASETPQPALVPVPDETPAPVEDSAAPTPAAVPPRQRPGQIRPGFTYDAPTYELINGEILKVETKTTRDGGVEESAKRILDFDPRIVSRLMMEEITDKDRLDVPSLVEESSTLMSGVSKQRHVSGFIIEYTHPASGEPVSTQVDLDDAVTCKWLSELDFSVDYSSTSSGKAEVWRAIQQVSERFTGSTLYQATGWRNDPDRGWIFIHAGGAIGADTVHTDLAVELSGSLSRYHLPHPATSADQLRRAFHHTSRLWEDMAPRIAIPMLGQFFRSPFGVFPNVGLLVGPPGSGKSGLAEVCMHHWGEKWRRNMPGTSLAGESDTRNALRIKASHAKDTVFWADDAAPDKGIQYTQTILKQTLRMFAESSDKERSDRSGSKSYSGGRVAASGLITSELAPEAGSGEERSFPIPLRKGDVDFDVLRDESTAEARYSRALVMATFLQWIAQRDPRQLREQLFADADQYLHHLYSTYLNPSRDERPGAFLAQNYVAWHLFTQFLVDREVYTAEEAADQMELVATGLREAFEATIDPDIPTSTGDRVREILTHALHTGSAFIADLTTGQAPDWRTASQLGWKILPAIYPGDAPRLDARGTPLGWLNRDGKYGPELYIVPTALDQVLKETSARLSSTLHLDQATAKRALYDEGMLITAKPRPGKSPTLTNSRQITFRRTEDGTIPRERVLVIPLHLLSPGGDDQGEDDPTPQPHGPAFTPTPAPAPVPAAPAPQPTTPVATVPPVTQGTTKTAPPRSTAPGQHRAPTTTPTFVAPAAVLDADGIYYLEAHEDSGSERRLDLPTLRHLGDIAELVPELGLGTNVTAHSNEIGQIWITHAGALSLGIPVDQLSDSPNEHREEIKTLTQDHPLVTGALEAGYHLGKKNTGTMTSWTRVFRNGEDKALAMLVLVPALSEQDYPLLDGASPATLATRLSMATEAIGMPPLMNPGSTGIDLMIKTRLRDKKRLFTPCTTVEPATFSNTERDLSWSRPLSDEERQRLYVHAYDRGGSYMAGASSLELGIGEPTHLTRDQGISFDKRLPGYWLVDIPATGDWRMPNPLIPGGQSSPHETTWFTTPTLAIAEALDYKPVIHEAYIWQEHSRILDPFYGRIRDGRNALQSIIHEPGFDETTREDAQLSLALLKQVYTRSIGMMGSEQFMKGRDGYAPERRHHIVAKAKANILWQVHKIGAENDQWPVAIATDTIVYLSNNPDPIASWPGDPSKFGYGFGDYKHEGSALLADHLEFLTGDGWKGKDHLIDPADWTE